MESQKILDLIPASLQEMLIEEIRQLLVERSQLEALAKKAAEAKQSSKNGSAAQDVIDYAKNKMKK